MPISVLENYSSCADRYPISPIGIGLTEHPMGNPSDVPNTDSRSVSSLNVASCIRSRSTNDESSVLIGTQCLWEGQIGAIVTALFPGLMRARPISLPF